MTSREIEEPLGRLLGWLETMKQPGGYAGPVAHYWRDSFRYIGPGLDWRYEGLITGFLTLHEKTGDLRFLDLAVEAGNHLVRGQFSNGSFRNSNFESNPSFRSGGTPHESAAAIGLLRLAQALGQSGRDGRPYAEAALRNVEGFHFGRLYDERTGLFFQYIFDRASHAPNKLATMAELLFLAHDAAKEERYRKAALCCLDFVLSMQDAETGGILQTDHPAPWSLFPRRQVAYYAARCVPALLEGFHRTRDERYLQGALRIGEFLQGMEAPGGGFWWALQEPKGGGGFRLYRYPVFAGGCGDILRALWLLREHGSFPLERSTRWLLAQVDPDGGVRTGYGMKRMDTEEEYAGPPSWRDVLHVVGWADKTLRYLALLLEPGTSVEVRPCPREPWKFQCADGLYEEDRRAICIRGPEAFTFRKRASFHRHDLPKRALMEAGFHYARVRREFGWEARLLQRAGMK